MGVANEFHDVSLKGLTDFLFHFFKNNIKKGAKELTQCKCNENLDS